MTWTSSIHHLNPLDRHRQNAPAESDGALLFADDALIPDDRPWLRGYDAGVPWEIDVPELTLDAAFLSAAAAAHPRWTAIRFFGQSISYRELDRQVNRFANMLTNLGVKPGDRVALMMPNCPQMVIGFYGTLRAGAVAVPTSPLYVASEVEHQVNDSGAKVVVCLSAMYPVVAEARPRLEAVQHVVVTNIKEHFPSATRLAFTLLREARDGHRQRLQPDGRTHWLQPLLHAASPVRPVTTRSADDLALLQYTGGTTGTPKGAMLTHRNLVANALQVKAWAQNLLDDPKRPVVTMGVIPLFHIYGITTVMNFTLACGGTMVLQPRFELQKLLEAIQHEKPAFLPGVPTMYAAINTAPDIEKYNLSSVRAAISGAASLPLEVQREFEDLTGACIVEGYGLTEASPVTHCTPLESTHHPSGIGLPLPGTESAVFDAETGTHRLPPGEIGELAVRGPQVMRGYWQREAETRDVLTEDGWLLTGDLGTMDAAGFFVVVDRKKDVIVSGGMNVYPRDVEEPLYQHPKVREAVAVGIPDPRWGEAVKVYIVLKDGSTATPREIQDYCHQHMAHYKVPKYVEFRRQLPKSLIGKFLRRALLQEEMAKQTTSSQQPPAPMTRAA